MAVWPYSTQAWLNLRAAKLSAQPVCEPCEMRGRTVLADAVDHIVAIAKGGDAFPPLHDLMSMCEACHNAKTNAVDHPNASGFKRALKGYDVDGNPIGGEDWNAPPCRAVAPDAPLADAGAFRSLAMQPIGPAAQNSTDLILRTIPN